MRVGGAVEVVIGIGALVVGGPVFAALVALSYLAFAGFVVLALRSGSPISSCGCFGKVDTPPSAVHVVIDLVAVGVATTVAIAGDVVALPDVLADQPLLGVPFVVLAVTGIYLVFLSFTNSAEDAGGSARRAGGTSLSVTGQEPRRPSRGIAFTNWLVSRSSRALERGTSRRGFLIGSAMVGSAVAVAGVDFATTPGTRIRGNRPRKLPGRVLH